MSSEDSLSHMENIVLENKSQMEQLGVLSINVTSSGQENVSCYDYNSLGDSIVKQEAQVVESKMSPIQKSSNAFGPPNGDSEKSVVKEKPCRRHMAKIFNNDEMGLNIFSKIQKDTQEGSTEIVSSQLNMLDSNTILNQISKNSPLKNDVKNQNKKLHISDKSNSPTKREKGTEMKGIQRKVVEDCMPCTSLQSGENPVSHFTKSEETVLSLNVKCDEAVLCAAGDSEETLLSGTGECEEIILSGTEECEETLLSGIRDCEEAALLANGDCEETVGSAPGDCEETVGCAAGDCEETVGSAAGDCEETVGSAAGDCEETVGFAGGDCVEAVGYMYKEDEAIRATGSAAVMSEPLQVTVSERHGRLSSIATEECQEVYVATSNERREVTQTTAVNEDCVNAQTVTACNEYEKNDAVVTSRDLEEVVLEKGRINILDSNIISHDQTYNIVPACDTSIDIAAQDPTAEIKKSNTENSEEMSSSVELAVLNGDYDRVFLLVNSGAKITLKAIVEAAKNDYSAIFDIFFAAGAIETVAQAREVLVETNSAYVAAAIIETWPNALKGEESVNLLVAAKNEDVLSVFMNSGGKVHADAALRLILRDGDSNRLSMFLNYINNVNGVICCGQTALHLAAEYNDTDCISVLLKRGADVNCTDRFGNKPIHRAVALDCKEAVKILGNAGAICDPIEECRSKMNCCPNLKRNKNISIIDHKELM